MEGRRTRWADDESEAKLFRVAARPFPRGCTWALLVVLTTACAFRTGGPPRAEGSPVGIERLGELTVPETWDCISSRLETSGFELIEKDREGGFLLAETQERIEGTLVRGGRTPGATIYSYLAVEVSSSAVSEGTTTVQVTAVSSEDRVDPARDEGIVSIEQPLRVSEEVLGAARSTLSVCGAPGADAE